MKIMAAFSVTLLLLNRDLVGFGPDIISYAGYLPRNFRAGLSPSNLELPVLQLACNV